MDPKVPDGTASSPKLPRPDRPADDIERTLNKLLTRPLQDEDKVLEIIVGAITAKYTDPGLVSQAVKQAIQNYENQLRVFMVAVANRQLARILRLMRSLDEIENQIANPDVIAKMEPRDLIKAYALQQSNLMSSLDYVKKVADMRIELASAQAAIANSLTTREVEEINALSGLPKLSPQQRGNVRRIVEGLVRDIADDNKDLEKDMQEGFTPGKGNGDGRKP